MTRFKQTNAVAVVLAAVLLALTPGSGSPAIASAPVVSYVSAGEQTTERIAPGYRFQAVKVRSTHSGRADVYAEVQPRKGGELVVRSVYARIVKRDGSICYKKMVHAYTDERNGTRVYVATVSRASQVRHVVLRSVYGSLRNVFILPLG